MSAGELFFVEGWACRREGVRKRGSVLTKYVLIDVPANGGTTKIPYRYAMHLLDNGFVGTDFSPEMWHGRPDRFSTLTSHIGLRVDFRKLTRICFRIFELDIASSFPNSIFVVCGSRTVGKDMLTANSNDVPTRKYRLYRAILTPIARDSGYRIVDDFTHSLFLLCPDICKTNAEKLIADYWEIRTRIDKYMGEDT